MRGSVLASSFEHDWDLVQAVHRKHRSQEGISLSPSADEHLILQLGTPFRARMRFDNGAGQEATVQGGQVILVPHGTPTQWELRPVERGGEPVRAEFLHLYLRRTAFDRLAGEMGGRGEPGELPGLLGVTDPLIRQLGSALREEMRRGTGGSRLYADSVASLLAVHLLRNYSGGGATIARAVATARGAVLDPKRLRIATEFIRDQSRRDLSLGEIAAAVRLSPYHFIRLFKNATGQTPYQYLIAVRVERAKNLLAQSSQSVGEIAHSVGFDSHTRFAIQFRRATGLTPSEYRAR